LHTSYAPLFNPETPEPIRSKKQDVLFKYYALLERTLTTQQWLMGEQFSVADAYLFTITNWAKHVRLDSSRLPAITAFQQRAAGRPQVREALLAVNGDNDVIIYMVNSVILREHIPNARLIIYPDANHGSLYRYPERFVENVSRFLA
jgi:pimeloyl-ACP methyl ester carboxylesterase